MSFGLFDVLRLRLPTTRVEVVVKAPFADLVAALPGVSAVHPLDPARTGSLVGLTRFGWSLRSGKFDAAVTLPHSFSSGWLARVTGATVRVGYPGDGRSPLLTHVIKPLPPGTHRVARYAHLLSPWLTDPTADLRVGFAVAVSPKLVGPKPWLGLNIHSEASSRRMSVEKWTRVADALIEQTGGTVVLTGAPKEKPRTDALAERIARPDHVLNLAGQTTAVELAAVFSGLSVVITGDTGPAHLADAVGTPTVVLFGASDERETAPFNRERSVGLRLDGLFCAPCVKNVCRFGTVACLEGLEEAMIVQAALSRV